MRGALLLISTSKAAARIIPADAGSTFAVLDSICSLADHPRGCGEHSPIFRTPACLPGSSPRMRGAPIHGYRSGNPNGIIPADAGSTGVKNAWSGIGEDHPRGCGEHDASDGATLTVTGSSPRMRGALP